MRARLSKQEVHSIESLSKRISFLMDRFENNDVLLDFGNESVYTQLSCASAALECILQEY